MRRPVQQPLFVLPVAERDLPDLERTVLEAIDKLGSVTARQAGEIAYRLRGRRRPADPAWYRSAGYPALDHLRELGLVRRRRNRFARAKAAA